MWRLSNDDSQAIITATEQIHSANGAFRSHLPETAIVFFMSKGTDYLIAHYDTEEFPEPFPCFLNRRPIWKFRDQDLCFLFGGSGAPQAADTVETLAVLGVKNIIAVGMCGAYDEKVQGGTILAPGKAFVEEGTSLHYYESIDAAYPDAALLALASATPGIETHPIVSTDAVYRQTFRKEQTWREKGAVGVDMETSAVFSVSHYLGLKAVALLMVSDVHPIAPGAPKWEWSMTRAMKDALTEQGLALAKRVIASRI